MKVLFVTEVFPPRLGGDGIHVLELCKSLQKQGVDVAVLTKAGERQALPFPVKRVGLPLEGLLGRLSFVIGAIKNYGLSREADIIHAHSAIPSIIGRVYALLSRKPTVVTVHTIWGESLITTRPAGVGLFLKAIESAILRLGFAYRITVTSEIASKLVKLNLKNVEYIPNGVDTDRFRPPANRKLLRMSLGFSDEKIILFVGRLVKQKNLALLLNAFNLMCKKEPNSVLLIVGNGPEEQALKGLAKELGLSGKVKFTGPMPQAELPKYYQISDCLALSSYWEGMPICALEAMSTGIPIACTRVGGLPSLVKTGVNGCLCGVDAGSLSHALLSCLKLDKMSARSESRKLVNSYSWASIAGRIKKVYEKVLLQQVSVQDA